MTGERGVALDEFRQARGVAFRIERHGNDAHRHLGHRQQFHTALAQGRVQQRMHFVRVGGCVGTGGDGIHLQ
ncbi:MAG: hypothetical protein HC872_04290 [Gammaproteobacteria bacterium]|nr:hypothetical protein [Gammaproteobacteria bacterium]